MVRKPIRRVEMYSVGGAVRDAMLGRDVVDRDWVVVGATPEMMIASGYTAVGRDFPVFLHPQTHEEYALARTERKHGRGYRGFEFFASPEVTVEQDLARRDLTINAMARAADGTLIDPYDGAGDLARGVLRHVSPAFAEDPLRVLRVARFAARFGFRVAPGTRRLMRRIVASGELATLAPERVWVEFAKGLAAADPYRMLQELDRCGALSALAPEVAARMADASTRRTLRLTLAHASAQGYALDRRYALLPADLRVALQGVGADRAQLQAAARAATALSARLKVPVDCRELANLAVQAAPLVFAADVLKPVQWLQLFTATDALRRPERLDAVLDVCAAVHAAAPRRPAAPAFAAADRVRAALAVIKVVDAGAIARAVPAVRNGSSGGSSSGGSSSGGSSGGGSGSGSSVQGPRRADAIAQAVRAARRAALRAWAAVPRGQRR